MGRTSLIPRPRPVFRCLQSSPTFLYCKRRKGGRGLGTRLGGASYRLTKGGGGGVSLAEWGLGTRLSLVSGAKTRHGTKSVVVSI